MLKSVRVYFNTKNMSAILKALQNRKVEVELKSEVVELGLVDDARELAKMVFNSRDNIVSILKRISKEAREGSDNADRAIKNTKEAIKKAKELGISDYPSNWDKIIKQMEERKKDFKQYYIS